MIFTALLFYVQHRRPLTRSLKVGKDGVEEIKHSHINVSPEPFDSDGYKGKTIYSTNNEQKHNIQGKYLYLILLPNVGV